jgi:hypothetical protein
MKKVLLVLTLTLGTLVSNSQEFNLNVKKFDEDRLYTSKVIELPNKNQKELVQQFKNWAGTAFVNLKEVMVAETDNQIVLNYIIRTYPVMKMLGMKTPMERGWYVRLVAQFKDGKIKVSIFDDGNTFIPGTYNRYGSTPAVQSRTFYVSNWYVSKPDDVTDIYKAKHFLFQSYITWVENADSMLISIESGMKNESLKSLQPKDDF